MTDPCPLTHHRQPSVSSSFLVRPTSDHTSPLQPSLWPSPSPACTPQTTTGSWAHAYLPVYPLSPAATVTCLTFKLDCDLMVSSCSQNSTHSPCSELLGLGLPSSTPAPSLAAPHYSVCSRHTGLPQGLCSSCLLLLDGFLIPLGPCLNVNLSNKFPWPPYVYNNPVSPLYTQHHSLDPYLAWLFYTFIIECSIAWYV